MIHFSEQPAIVSERLALFILAQRLTSQTDHLEIAQKQRPGAGSIFIALLMQVC